MSEKENKYRLALLNIAGTGRKWAVGQGGNTPLAIVAGMARDALGMTVQQVDEEIETLNRTVNVEERPLVELPPVDRSAQELENGSPVTQDHREIDPATGMQKHYVVLSPEERSKGFIRPFRRTYLHKPCGSVTTMGNAIAETYARDPKFYSGTFCCTCRAHFPLDQFVWDGTNEQVGS